MKRKIRVRKHRRKGKSVKSYTKKIGVVKKSERKIFNHISNPSVHKIEYGGGLDFDKKGRLENINMVPGKAYEVTINDDDYEAIYHTHPAKEWTPPSPEDIEALLSNKKQQAEIVFQKGRAFIIVKTPSSRALSRLPATQLSKKLDKAYSLLEYTPNWENKWKKYLESLGFIVYVDNNPNEKLEVKIIPKEPKRNKK